MGQFIADFDPELPYPYDTNSLNILLMAIDGKEQTGDEPAEDLGHQPLSTSGYQVIDVEMLLPPPQEFLDVPARFVNERNLFVRQVESVRSDIVFNVIHMVTNDANWLFGLVLAFGSQPAFCKAQLYFYSFLAIFTFLSKRDQTKSICYKLSRLRFRLPLNRSPCATWQGSYPQTHLFLTIQRNCVLSSIIGRMAFSNTRQIYYWLITKLLDINKFFMLILSNVL